MRRGGDYLRCFPRNSESSIFADTDNNDRITNIKEKQRISMRPTIDLYWASSYTIYRQVYERFCRNLAHMEREEKYIVPMHRRPIAKEREPFLNEVPPNAVILLGIPVEVNEFLAQHAPSI
jgi:hypothetical protein